MSYYRTQLEDFLGMLDVKCHRVYDVGGVQGEVKSRVKTWDVKDYRVLDLPEFDLQEDWSHKHFLLKEQANIVFCLEVFEYLIDPLQAIKNISFILKDNATTKSKAYISVPLIYPVHNEIELDALRYTENGFRRLCKAAQLDVTAVWYRRPVNDLLSAYYGSDGMKAAKGVDHKVTGYIFEVTK